MKIIEKTDLNSVEKLRVPEADTAIPTHLNGWHTPSDIAIDWQHVSSVY